MEQEKANFWHAHDLGSMELLHAHYITHSFDRHVHEGYAIGVITHGAEAFFYRGAKNNVAAAGSIVVVNPNEIHTGHAVTENGWQYRMFYPGVTWMRQIARELTGTNWDTPHFPDAVIDDAEIRAQLVHLHRVLQSSASALERGSLAREAFGNLITRYATNRSNPLKIGDEREIVNFVRTYLETHLDENTSLEDLAAMVHMSPYHLLRVFRKSVGMPPHSYRNHVRLTQAKALLAAGKSITDISHEVGFPDQSHFTRRFKAMVGVPPGEYARSL